MTVTCPHCHAQLKLKPALIKILKDIQCAKCRKRFPIDQAVRDAGPGALARETPAPTPPADQAPTTQAKAEPELIGAATPETPAPTSAPDPAPAAQAPSVGSAMPAAPAPAAAQPAPGATGAPAAAEVDAAYAALEARVARLEAVVAALKVALD